MWEDTNLMFFILVVIYRGCKFEKPIQKASVKRVGKEMGMADRLTNCS